MKKIGLLVMVAFVVRIASLFALRLFADYPLRYNSEFDVIALNILSGKGYVFNYCYRGEGYFYFVPLYTYFLAFVHFIAGESYLTVLQIMQAIIAAVSVIPLIAITKKMFGERTSLLAALLYCLHPGLIVYTGFSSEFTLTVCFLLTTFWLMVCCKHTKALFIAIGIAMGFGLLLRPTVISLIPAFFIYLLIKKIPIKKIIGTLCIIILFAAIVIAPWIYRGYVLYNRFVFLSLHSSEMFWQGNNPIATGALFTENGERVFNDAYLKCLSSLDEIERKQFFHREAVQFIKKYPFDFLKLTVRKFIYFWSFSPYTGFLYPQSWLIIYAFLYFLLALFFLFGMYGIRKNKHCVDISIVVFLLSFCILNSFAQSLFYVNTKHRWLIEPLLMMITSYGIMQCVRKWSSLREKMNLSHFPS